MREIFSKGRGLPIFDEEVGTANDIDGKNNNGDGNTKNCDGKNNNGDGDNNNGDGNSNKNGDGEEQSWISRQSGSMLGPGLTVSGARPLIGHQLHPVCHQYVSVRSTAAQIVQSYLEEKWRILGESE